MKKLKLILYLLLFAHCGLAQTRQHENVAHATSKPSIDHSIYNKWPEVGNAKISNNGEYTMYSIFNMPLGSSTLVIQSINKLWCKKFIGVAGADFTQDNKQAVFKLPGDSLCLLDLGKEDKSYIPHVVSYKIGGDGKGECLVYRLNAPLNGVVVRNLYNGMEQQFTDVADYLLSDNGRTLLLVIEERKDNTVNYALQWVNLPNGSSTIIWRGTKASTYVFDIRASQLAFIVEETKNDQIGYSLWWYKDGMKEAEEWVNDYTASIGRGLAVSNFPSPRFSKDGTKLFFSLKEVTNAPTAKPNVVKVDVWHYKDERLQSEQLNKRHQRPKQFTALVKTGTKNVIQLTRENDQMAINGADISERNDYVLIWEQVANRFEANWRLSARPSLYIVSTKDGERTLVTKDPFALSCISSGGKYVVYYNLEKGGYFSYDIESGVTICITEGIPVPMYDEENSNPGFKSPVMHLAGWLQDDKAVLVYDLYDIWQVDPAGVFPPINITSGYGRKHHIVFRLTTNDREIIPEDKTLLLTAFDKESKYNGFYSIQIGKKDKPKLLTMGPYIYSLPQLSISSFISRPFSPIKSKYANAYIVRRESVLEAPNYYFTRDFKTYLPLSNVNPQRKYNWMTSELIHWRTFDGSFSDGILYKPENFDSTKKYPVIFYFYEKLSDKLHQFLQPEPIPGALRPAWYISNGYLVFIPDIHYTIGEPGESVYNSVVSAAKYLIKMPWVDSTRMGIQGHSFGGYEVNYLVTRTNIFAAAASAAGVSDCISQYGDLNTEGGFGLQWFYESGQGRIGSTLWENPELYVENSPIFKADKVQTPILLMHNKGDDAVPFGQAVEWFTALRRLDKKVWLLQYDGYGHQLLGSAAKDYTLRLAQFFNYYLKGENPPKWLTIGIPARMKGIDLGLELDAINKCP